MKKLLLVTLCLISSHVFADSASDLALSEQRMYDQAQARSQAAYMNERPMTYSQEGW